MERELFFGLGQISAFGRHQGKHVGSFGRHQLNLRGTRGRYSGQLALLVKNPLKDILPPPLDTREEGKPTFRVSMQVPLRSVAS